MRLALFALLTIGACTTLGCAPSNLAAKEAAVEAAEAWLALLDSGQYATSWRLASESFQAAVPEARWKDKAMGVRMQCGKLLSRQVKSARYTTSLPGAPDGQRPEKDSQRQQELKATRSSPIFLMRHAISLRRADRVRPGHPPRAQPGPTGASRQSRASRRLPGAPAGPWISPCRNSSIIGDPFSAACGQIRKASPPRGSRGNPLTILKGLCCTAKVDGPAYSRRTRRSNERTKHRRPPLPATDSVPPSAPAEQ